jgi:hypothetical protein
MIKNIAMIIIKKAEKEFELHIKDNSSWAEIFDVAMELRQMALNALNEQVAQEQKKPEEAVQPEEVKEEPKPE